MTRRPARTGPARPARGTRLGPVPWLILLGAALTLVIGWLDRGFDLTDEGYYLLGYRHPGDVFLTLSHFHHLVAALTLHQDWPVLFYRVLGLLVVLAPCLFFALELHRFARRGAPGRAGSRALALSAFTALGGLIAYTVGPRSLSYNGLGNACMLIEAGIALRLIGGGPAGAAHRLGLAATLGIVLAAQLVIKATAAALIGVWIVAAGATLGLGGPRRWLELGAGAAFGAAVFAAAFFAWIVPFHDWWTGISITREAMRSLYSPAALASSSLMPLGREIVIAGPPLLLSAALIGIGRRLVSAGRRTLGEGLVTFAALITLGPALLIGVLPGSELLRLNGGTRVAMLVALALALRFTARPPARAAAPAPGGARLLILLAVLPLLAALGTNNALSIQVQLHLAPWFALLWLSAEEMPEAPGLSWSDAVTAAAGLIAVVLIGRSQLVDPYRIPGGMAEQRWTFSSRIEAGRGLEVDEGTKRLVEDTRDLLDRNGFRPGDPVLAFYDLPGLVFLLGGRSPETPWFFRGADSLTVRAIALAQRDLERERVFVLTRRRLSAPIVASLDRAGLLEGMRALGTVKGRVFLDVAVIERRPPGAR